MVASVERRVRLSQEREVADVTDDDEQAWKPSQILLAWSLLRGGRKEATRDNNTTLCGTVVVKASSKEQMLENYKVLEKDFSKFEIFIAKR